MKLEQPEGVLCKKVPVFSLPHGRWQRACKEGDVDE